MATIMSGRSGRPVLILSIAASIFVSGMGFVLTACEDSTPSSASGNGTIDAETGDASTGDCESWTDKETHTTIDASKNNDASDTGISGEALKISDSQGRFASRSFTDYTCPDLPGFGRVLQWIIPEDIRVAVGLPSAAPGSYHLQVEGASNDNVIIVGPPTDKKYFTGSQSILVTQTGTLPSTSLTAATPATGTVTVEGTWSCP